MANRKMAEDIKNENNAPQDKTGPTPPKKRETRDGILDDDFFDDDFTEEYYDEYCEYYKMKKGDFLETIDKWANKDLFEKKNRWEPKFEVK